MWRICLQRGTVKLNEATRVSAPYVLSDWTVVGAVVPLTSPALLSRLTPTLLGEEGDSNKKLHFQLPSLPEGWA